MLRVVRGGALAGCPNFLFSKIKELLRVINNSVLSASLNLTHFWIVVAVVHFLREQRSPLNGILVLSIRRSLVRCNFLVLKKKKI